MKDYKSDEVRITWNGIPLEGFDQDGTLIITKTLPAEVHEVECEIIFTDEYAPILKELSQKELNDGED